MVTKVTRKEKKKMNFEEFIGKKVWILYEDGDKERSMTCIIESVKDSIIFCKTHDNQLIIPIKRIYKIKKHLKDNGK